MLETAWEFDSPLRHHKNINGPTKIIIFVGPFFVFQKSYLALLWQSSLHNAANSANCAQAPASGQRAFLSKAAIILKVFDIGTIQRNSFAINTISSYILTA